jgi:hypothetical protein
MQKWEYLVFGLSLGKQEGYRINGKYFEHDYGYNNGGDSSVETFMQQKMGELGGQGWELVAEGKFSYIFKRPVH